MHFVHGLSELCLLKAIPVVLLALLPFIITGLFPHKLTCCVEILINLQQVPIVPLFVGINMLEFMRQDDTPR